MLASQASHVGSKPTGATMTRETKTTEDVKELLLEAFGNKVKVKFIDGPVSGKMSYSSAAELYSVMSPTDMWYELARKLADASVNVNLASFKNLEEYYKNFKEY